MYRHLRYFSEELVAFSFFDDAISFETKQHIVAKLQDEDDEQVFHKRSWLPLDFLTDKYFQDFVITEANTFFEILDFIPNFTM